MGVEKKMGGHLGELSRALSFLTRIAIILYSVQWWIFFNVFFLSGKRKRKKIQRKRKNHLKRRNHPKRKQQQRLQQRRSQNSVAQKNVI
jgi:hypothetical protein